MGQTVSTAMRNLIRGTLPVAALLLLALAFGPLPGNSAGLDREICERCRRDWDGSPSRMRLTLDFDGHHKDYLLCSPFCVLEELELHPGEEPTSLFILNYRELDSQESFLIRADRAFFLYGIAGDKSENREPYVAAFNSEKYAQEAKAKLGGELLKWEAVRRKVKKLTDDYEAPGPRPYERLNKRGGSE